MKTTTKIAVISLGLMLLMVALIFGAPTTAVGEFLKTYWPAFIVLISWGGFCLDICLPEKEQKKNQERNEDKRFL